MKPFWVTSFQEKLGHRPLEGENIDGLEIRIWASSHAGVGVFRILNIGNKNWCEKFAYFYNEEQSFSKNLIPLSGWENFWKILSEVEFFRIFSFHFGEPFLCITNGIGYFIELKKKNDYSFMHIENPETYDSSDSRKFLEIMKFLQCEFSKRKTFGITGFI